MRVVTLDIAGDVDVSVDVADELAPAAAAAEVGSIDVLISSAGIVGPGVSLIETQAADRRRVFDVNVFGMVATWSTAGGATS